MSIITDALTGDITSRKELDESIESTQEGINTLQEVADPFSGVPEEEQPTEFAVPPIYRSPAGATAAAGGARAAAGKVGAVFGATALTNALAGGGVGEGDSSPATTPVSTRGGDTDFGSESDRESPLDDTRFEGIAEALQTIANAIETAVKNADKIVGGIIVLALIYIVGQLFTFNVGG